MRSLRAGILQQAANLATKKQYALSFDGVNDKVDITGVIGSSLDFDISVEVRIKTIGQFGTVFSYRSGQDLFQMFKQNEGELRGQLRGSKKILIELKDYEHTEDAYFTYEYGTKNGVLYLKKDNVEIASRITDTLVGSVSSNYMLIGASVVDLFLKCDISNFTVRNLSNSTIIADYDFTTGNGDTLFDKSGNNNHGTIYGAQWVEI